MFAVPQLDGARSIGQVVDHPMPNVASCIFADVRIPGHGEPDHVAFDHADLIAAVWTTPDLLDTGRWPVIGRREPLLSGESRPNEKYRSSGWIGAKTYGSGIIEAFLNAYYRLRPWDDWHDPAYLDALLISPDRKPVNPILTRSAQ